jgi:hypothetical protein
MLDVHRLRDQFPDFNRYQARERALITEKLRVAREALQACDGTWEALRDRAASSDLGLVARLREAPAQAHTAPPRPTPITVVATDGSQIYPDRHVEPSCYLLNISRIAFQYGTLERPLMESVPRFRYRRAEMEDLYDALLENASAEVVSAVRDEYELAELLGTARAVRLPQRPLVAMADGTLIRWMLRGMRNHALEQALIERYTRLLDDFQGEAIALCSYISMPGGTEVINLLRVHNGETADTPPDAADSLAGLTDRWLFEQTLAPGERSALFESASRIQRAYGESRICFFYLGIPAASGVEQRRQQRQHARPVPDLAAMAEPGDT